MGFCRYGNLLYTACGADIQPVPVFQILTEVTADYDE